MNQTPATTKISISVYPALLERFKRSLGQVIKRDSFLNDLIAQEVPMLRAELGDRRNSDAARRHIARELRKLKPATINVVVDKEVAQQLNAVVQEMNLCRDAVLNFLLYCLDPMPGFFRRFELPEFWLTSTFNTLLDPPRISPLGAIRSTLEDPFYYLRTAVEEVHGVGLYALELPPAMHGLACYLPDSSVPNTRAAKALAASARQMLAELEQLDAAAFGGKS